MIAAGDLVMRVDGLQLQRGTRAILQGVSIEVQRGEMIAVMGPSGSGKTTILRAIAGLERFQSGTISVDGVALTNAGAASDTLRALRRKVGMVFQFHCLFEHLTALENVCLAPVHAHHVPVDAAKQRAMELLTAFGVDHRAGALPRHLSGGEAQRVAIARALAVDPPVLLMDEPTASLDPERRAELGALLSGLRRQGRTLVISTHDDDFAQEFATRVVRLRDGRLEGTGSTEGTGTEGTEATASHGETEKRS
jgi:polar amino acid transport system ATP-binding protein